MISASFSTSPGSLQIVECTEGYFGGWMTDGASCQTVGVLPGLWPPSVWSSVQVLRGCRCQDSAFAQTLSPALPAALQ